MTANDNDVAIVEQPAVTPDKQFQHLVKLAILKVPNGKAIGSDEIFSKALRYPREETAELLTSIWQMWGDLKTAIRQRDTAILVPIYKKGPKDDPRSSHPIALLPTAEKSPKPR